MKEEDEDEEEGDASEERDEKEVKSEEVEENNEADSEEEVRNLRKRKRKKLVFSFSLSCCIVQLVIVAHKLSLLYQIGQPSRGRSPREKEEEDLPKFAASRQSFRLLLGLQNLPGQRYVAHSSELASLCSVTEALSLNFI